MSNERLCPFCDDTRDHVHTRYGDGTLGAATPGLPKSTPAPAAAQGEVAGDANRCAIPGCDNTCGGAQMRFEGHGPAPVANERDAKFSALVEASLVEACRRGYEQCQRDVVELLTDRAAVIQDGELPDCEDEPEEVRGAISSQLLLAAADVHNGDFARGAATGAKP